MTKVFDQGPSKLHFYWLNRDFGNMRMSSKRCSSTIFHDFICSFLKHLLKQSIAIHIPYTYVYIACNLVVVYSCGTQASHNSIHHRLNYMDTIVPSYETAMQIPTGRTCAQHRFTALGIQTPAREDILKTPAGGLRLDLQKNSPKWWMFKWWWIPRKKKAKNHQSKTIPGLESIKIPSLRIQSPNLRWWLGCIITSETKGILLPLPFSEGDWIPRALDFLPKLANL